MQTKGERITMTTTTTAKPERKKQPPIAKTMARSGQTEKTGAELVTEDATAGLEAATAALHSVMMGELGAAAGAEAPPAPLIYSDKFTLFSDAFRAESVKGMELPKIIMKKVRDDQQAIHEKSSIMIYLNVTAENIRNGCFKQLYKASKKGPIKLELHWTDEPSSEEEDAEEAGPAKKKQTKSAAKAHATAMEDKEPLSVWKFEGARIQALDFGTAVCKRPDINMLGIEVTFENVEIDGISL